MVIYTILNMGHYFTALNVDNISLQNMHNNYKNILFTLSVNVDQSIKYAMFNLNLNCIIDHICCSMFLVQTNKIFKF